MNQILFGLLLILYPATMFAQGKPVLNAMQQEMARTMKDLSQTPNPPYFISYSVAEVNTTTITASFGALDCQ